MQNTTNTARAEAEFHYVAGQLTDAEVMALQILDSAVGTHGNKSFAETKRKPGWLIRKLFAGEIARTTLDSLVQAGLIEMSRDDPPLCYRLTRTGALELYKRGYFVYTSTFSPIEIVK